MILVDYRTLEHIQNTIKSTENKVEDGRTF